MPRLTTCLSALVLVLAAASLAACGSGGGGGGGDGKVPDPHAKFGPVTTTTTKNEGGQLSALVPATEFQFAVIGTKEVGGRTWSRFMGGYDVPAGQPMGSTTPGTEVWVDGLGTGTVTIAGFESHAGLGTIFASPMSVTLDTPVKLPLDPPADKPQQQTWTGTLQVGTGGTPQPVSMTTSYTLVEDHVSVSTRMGTVSDCRHFNGTAAVSGAGIPAVLAGQSATGDIWYNDSLGIVAAKSPALGIDVGLEGESDNGTVVNGVAVIRKVAVPDATHPFVLDTYDREGKLDADMCVEAKMLAEVRWANDADAKTKAQPDPTLFQVTLTGGMGQFCWGGCTLVESSVSIFHPEDNGKGYKFWYTYQSAAQKNMYSPGMDKGTNYAIGATTSSTLPPIRVTARISYAIASAGSDCSME